MLLRRMRGEGHDQSACLGQTACYNIGHRTTVTDAGGNEEFAYDKMGREIAEQRTTSGHTKSTSYGYDLAGDMTSLVYPSGRTVTYTYDSAGRPSDAVDTANSINYEVGPCTNGASTSPTTGVCYAPNGAVTQEQNGANLVTTYIYNKRFQPCWMFATTGAPLATSTACTAADPGPGNILDLQYNFNLGAGDNGNVVGITNNRDTTRSESFTYDALNRIATGQTSATSGANCWGQSYTIDQWGNLTNIGHVSGYSACSQGSLSVSALTNNQLSSTGFSYDGAGNMTNDGANAYTYNAESETTSAAGVTYTYDGDGNRVEKSNGRLFWYGAGSEILDESDLTGSITLEMVYFGGKRVAHRTSSNVIYYYEGDLLGSARTILQAGSTSPCYDADFLPFGGERVITNTCSQNYKFEGKKRDLETGNDDFDARYYRSNIGRWMSADWSSVPAPVPYANLTNPQTLNLYAMVSDNPETFADLDGHACTYGPSGQENCKDTANTNANAPATTGEGHGTGDGLQKSPTQQAQSILIFNVGVGGQIGAEAQIGPVSANLSASVGVEADVTDPSVEAAAKVDSDVKIGDAQVGGEAKLTVATLDENGLHADLKPSLSVGAGGEKKTFGSQAAHDTDKGFIVSGKLKAGVASFEVGVNLTALGNRVVQAARDLVSIVQLSKNLDFRGLVPRYSPPGP